MDETTASPTIALAVPMTLCEYDVQAADLIRAPAYRAVGLLCNIYHLRCPGEYTKPDDLVLLSHVTFTRDGGHLVVFIRLVRKAKLTEEMKPLVQTLPTQNADLDKMARFVEAAVDSQHGDKAKRAEELRASLVELRAAAEKGDNPEV